MENDTVQSVIQSNFIRNYRTVLQREKDIEKLPVKLRELLEITGEKMSLREIESNTNQIDCKAK